MNWNTSKLKNLIFVLPMLSAFLYACIKPPTHPIFLTGTAVATTRVATFQAESPVPAEFASGETFYTRATASGKIIETGYSIYPSRYFFINQWFAEYSDKKVFVFAGAIRTDGSKGGREREKPWPGVMVVDTFDLNGERLHEESGVYELEKTGPLRIIDEKDGVLFLVANNWEEVTFDLATKKFGSPDKPYSTVRNAADGLISEFWFRVFPSGAYSFVNYWMTLEGTSQDTRQVYVAAGALRDQPDQGIVVKYVMRKDGKFLGGWVYPIPGRNGAVRIIDTAGDTLVLADVYGVVLGFSVQTGKFYEWHHGTFTPLNENLQPSPEPYTSETPPTPTPSLTPTLFLPSVEPDIHSAYPAPTIDPTTVPYPAIEPYPVIGATSRYAPYPAPQTTATPTVGWKMPTLAVSVTTTPVAAPEQTYRLADKLLEPYFLGIPLMSWHMRYLDAPFYSHSFGCVQSLDAGFVVQFYAGVPIQSIIREFDIFLKRHRMETDGWKAGPASSVMGNALTLSAKHLPDERFTDLLTLDAAIYNYDPYQKEVGKDPNKSILKVGITRIKNFESYQDRDDRVGALVDNCPNEEWWSFTGP